MPVSQGCKVQFSGADVAGEVNPLQLRRKIRVDSAARAARSKKSDTAQIPRESSPISEASSRGLAQGVVHTSLNALALKTSQCRGMKNQWGFQSIVSTRDLIWRFRSMSVIIAAFAQSHFAQTIPRDTNRRSCLRTCARLRASRFELHDEKSVNAVQAGTRAGQEHSIVKEMGLREIQSGEAPSGRLYLPEVSPSCVSVAPTRNVSCSIKFQAPRHIQSLPA